MPLFTESKRPFNCASPNDMYKMHKAIHVNRIGLNIVKKITKINLPTSVKTNYDFVNFVKRSNVFCYVVNNIPSVSNGEVFECLLIDGNQAWIEKDHVGNYRYFTKTTRATNALGLDIFQLFQLLNPVDVLSRKSFLLARREITNLLDADYEEFNWEKGQIAKYKINIEIINRPAFCFIDNHIAKVIENHKDILLLLNQVGMKNISIKQKSIHNESPFHISMNSLSEILACSTWEVSDAISRLRDVGLLNVFKSEELPENHVNPDYPSLPYNLYTIPFYNELLINAISEKITEEVRHA